MDIHKIFPVFLFIIFIFFSKCNTTEPPDKGTLTLTFEDASCTEIWLTLTTENLQLPTTIELKQDDQTRSIINLVKPDTLLYMDSLLPSQTYKFHASMQTNNHASNELSVTTMDTTSHNFSFISYQFGEHSSSTLYDVAIIDENNIWAVGEIYMNDSLGQPDPMPYNAVHWDGTSWDTMRIPTKTFSGTIVSSVIRTIFYFNENDIWTFSIAGSYSHWNGNNWETEFVNERDGTGIKLWGTSSTDLYLGCSNGGITFYNGIKWQKITSGTNLDIYDIWGKYNSTIGEYEIIAVAAEVGVSFEKKILRINMNGSVTSLPTEGIPYSIHGIWFKGKNYFVVGSGMYKKYDINSSSNWTAIHQGISNYYIETIRGNDLNNIIACGAFGELLHFNGISWKSYVNITSINGSIGGKIKGNTICCYGFNDSKAIVIIGRR
jgi:hypothetical protein